MLVENLVTGCLLAIAFAAFPLAVSISRAFLGRTRRREERRPSGSFLSTATLRGEPERAAMPVVRGYDSPELFRQDWWLVRIERSRTGAAGLETTMESLHADGGSPEVYQKRVCAALARQRGAIGDN